MTSIWMDARLLELAVLFALRAHLTLSSSWVVPAGQLMLFLGALLCTAALTASPLDSAGHLRADSRNEPPRGQSGRELSASKRQLQQLEVLQTTRQFGVGDDTPLGPEVDCRVRRLAAEYAGVTQRDAGASWARRPDLLHDALELSARCNDTRPPKPSENPPWASTAPDSKGYFVNAATGDDTASGTEAQPLKTLTRALERVAAGESGRTRTVTLRGGVHRLLETVEMTHEHSHTVITQYCAGNGTPCETAWLSGGVELPELQWSLFDPSRNVWRARLEATTPSLAAAIAAAGSPQSSLNRRGDREEQTDVDRARWPNRRPADGTIDRPSLLDLTHTDAEWHQKGVLDEASPKLVVRPSVPATVTTEFNHWVAGVGGECARFSPPVAWICSPNSTGGGVFWDSAGPLFPTALALGANISSIFPNAARWRPRDVAQAVLTSWTNGWFTSHFDLADFENDTLVFGPRGGVQGGRGWHFDGSLPGPPKICSGSVRENDCGPVKIEGLLAELDAPNEYWVDPVENFLYFKPNSTDGQVPNETFVVPVLKELLQLRGEYDGDPAASLPTLPVANVTLRGIGFRDGARTFLEPHGVPSGGDWALQRTGAVVVEGTEGVVLQGCSFKYLGGVALLLSGYNRGAVINASHFAYLGGSAVAAWGYTASTDPTVPVGTGIDGTAGNFPRGTKIVGTICREMGTVEKQSSCYFGAKTAETVIRGCAFFNGPRAMINLNDMLGGGTVIERNVLFNSCRESGDHGVVNTWSRIPFLTTVRTGQPSLQPKPNSIASNLFISNYNSFDGVDNDDGSSWYDIGHNVFYLNEGLKSDYHGHDKTYHDNLNLGAGVCCFQFGFITGRDTCRGGTCPGTGDLPSGEFYQAGHTDHCVRNHCVQRPGGSWVSGAFAILWGCNASLPGCAPPGETLMEVSGNTLYREPGRTCGSTSGCDVACGMGNGPETLLSAAEFQQRCGQPVATTVRSVPSPEELEQMARSVLELS